MIRYVDYNKGLYINDLNVWISVPQEIITILISDSDLFYDDGNAINDGVIIDLVHSIVSGPVVKYNSIHIMPLDIWVPVYPEIWTVLEVSGLYYYRRAPYKNYPNNGYLELK